MTKVGIKNAAFRLFAEKGYDATTMNDIAEAVGIKKPSIYVHFINKNDILNSILQDQYLQISASIKKVLERDHNYEICAVLKMIFLDAVNYFSDKVNLLFWKRMLIGYSPVSADGEDPVANVIEKVRKESLLAIYRLCLNCQSIKREDFNLVVQYFYQFILGFLDIMIILSEKDLEQNAQQSWTFFCNGIKEHLK